MSGRQYLRQRVGAVATDGQADSYLNRRMDASLAGDEVAQAAYRSLRDKVRDQLLTELDPNLLFRPHDDELMNLVGGQVRAILERDTTIPATARDSLVNRLVRDLVGFGPIQCLIDDPGVSEIMVNRWDDVWVERQGCLSRMPQIAFEDDRAVRDLCERIALPLRRRIDDRNPILDARLPDGSRVCATLSPPALDGCSLAVRKFSGGLLSVQALTDAGTFDPAVVEFLGRCVRCRVSILVAGGTSSGKTTILNALSSLIPPGERIITIEDAAELRLQQPHVLRYETRQGNSEGKGAITIRELVRTALRLRPDRIIVGEVRGPEALDMVQAQNTGHDGGFSTLHANSVREALSRLETMVLMADSGLPLPAVRQQVAAAFDLVIGCVRLANGHRRIVEIAAVEGVCAGEYAFCSLFRLDPVAGQLLPTGLTSQRLNDRFVWAAGDSRAADDDDSAAAGRPSETGGATDVAGPPATETEVAAC